MEVVCVDKKLTSPAYIVLSLPTVQEICLKYSVQIQSLTAWPITTDTKQTYA